MEGKLDAISYLAEESEKITNIQSPNLALIRRSFHEHEVSAWNNESISIHPVLGGPSSPKKSSKQSVISLESASKKDNIFSLYELREKKLKRESIKSLNSATPTAYKIANIYLNDKQVFLKDESEKKYTKNTTFPKLSKNSFASAYFSHPKKQKKIELKKTVISGISNVFDLLKPELKNPITTIVTPQLKSKYELGRFYKKKKENTKKNLDLIYFNRKALTLLR